jgi:hypothetical protein
MPWPAAAGGARRGTVSHLPREALTYQTVVAEYFLGLRGAGLMLSPLDLEQVRAWEVRGIPVAVVCRGLRRGVEDAPGRRGPAAPGPRSLRAYRLEVEEEWRAYRGNRVGDAPPPPDEAAAAGRRLAAALALLERAAAIAPGAGAEAHRAAREALGAVRCASTLEQVEVALAAADAALLRGWLLGLPRRRRAAFGPRCRLHAGPRPAWMRRVEYRATLRAHLLDAARPAGLLCLRGSV